MCYGKKLLVLLSISLTFLVMFTSAIRLPEELLFRQGYKGLGSLGGLGANRIVNVGIDLSGWEQHWEVKMQEHAERTRELLCEDAFQRHAYL